MTNNSNFPPPANILGASSKVERDKKLKTEDVLLCYMHAEKFDNFLAHGLSLTRSDFFQKDDPFEAEFTEGIYNFVKDVTITDRNGKIETGLKSLKDQCDQIRKECFVSCWTQGPFENVALWRIFGKQENAVAIKTNVRKLMVQLENYINTPDPRTGLDLRLCRKRIIKVKYIDHHNHKDEEKLIGPQDTEILHFKNVGYKYENEVRIIFDTYHTAAASRFGERILINICLEEFIEQILVSPYASNCYFESIKKLLIPYNLADKVRWSKLKYVPGANMKETIGDDSQVEKLIKKFMCAVKIFYIKIRKRIT